MEEKEKLMRAGENACNSPDKGGHKNLGGAKFALIGENISYSLSPAIHTFIYEHLGIKAQYSLISISKTELAQKIEILKTLDGFNVTQPHKNSVLKYLTENFSGFDAVNTVKGDNGALYGYNTDEYGFSKHISGIIEIKGKSVLIFGAGGMAEIAAAVLVKQGAKVYILNRTHSKAVEVSAKTGAEAVESAKTLSPNIVVNCSSQGLFDKSYELPVFCHDKLELAYDTIYFETAFSKSFKDKGIKVANGLKLLIYQAIRAEEIFLNIEIENKQELCEIIEKALAEKKGR